MLIVITDTVPSKQLGVPDLHGQANGFFFYQNIRVVYESSSKIEIYRKKFFRYIIGNSHRQNETWNTPISSNKSNFVTKLNFVHFS